MAILTKEVTIAEGSDEGKTFVVSQMPLLRGDRWANRAALAIMRADIDLSSLKGLGGAKSGDFTGMLDIAEILSAVLKALGGIEEHVAQELLDELLAVVKLKLPNGATRPIIPPSEHADGDITSIATLWKLRIEAIKVNLDFLKAGVTR